MNQKGISIMSLVITIIVILIIASISMISSTKSIDQATEVKFKNDLKEVVTALEVYHQQANLHGVPSYNSDELKWDGVSERAENTAKIEDSTNEDRIRYIFTDEVPKTLVGKITIEDGRIKVEKSYKTEYEWATEQYSYMEY